METIEEIEQELKQDLASIRVKYLGKYGKISSILSTLSDIDSDSRKAVGNRINTVVNHIKYIANAV